jgi:ABC-type multidrug transport system fused ATPase/permease subunit
MIAEIAAANAAFAVIKSALANGKELHQLGSRVFDYFDNKAVIQEKATKNGNGSDMEEFMALERFKQQEEELRERMVYAGRPGMWDDWVKFQAAAARKRREAKEAAAREKARRAARLAQLTEYIVLSMAAVILAALIIYGIVLYMRYLR